MPATYTVEWDEDGDGTFGTDITAYLMEFSIDRGRRTDIESIRPGRATLVLKNGDGRFSPDKAAGPYYGNLELYRRVRIKAVLSATSYGLFWGYLVGMNLKPHKKQQVATWFLGDLFTIWQDKKASVPLIRQVPVQTALHVALSRIEGRNKISNPSLEKDATGWSAIGGASADRDETMSLEGDYSYRVDCPGDANGEGCRYDASSDFAANNWWTAYIFAKVDAGTATLRFRGYDDQADDAYNDIEVGTDWTLIPIDFDATVPYYSRFDPGSSNRYFKVETTGSWEGTFWVDVLWAQHIQGSPSEWMRRDFDDSTAEIEFAAAYRESGLDLLCAIAESEPRTFFFPYMGFVFAIPYERIRFRDKDYRGLASIAATFSDDGADVPYFDLDYGEGAEDRISEAEVTSRGTYQDENVEVTIWELSPRDEVIPANESIVILAPYSQPARNCSLVIPAPPTTFEIAIAGDAGQIVKWEDAYPPSAEDNVTTGDSLRLGQVWGGQYYWINRSYLRFDTSGIPDGASITSAKLRCRLKIDLTDTDFTIQVRDNAWGAILALGDWDGTGTIRGTRATSGLPHVDVWFDIDIAVAAIDKTGYTEFELTSDREVAETEPTGNEVLVLHGHKTSPPLLIVEYVGSQYASTEFENFGIGANITLEAGGMPIAVGEVEIKGVPLAALSEESKVVAASASPPPVDRTLTLALPLQATRTASMETEATRLADRYDGRIRRPALTLKPKNDTVLTQMLAREIGELIHVENIQFAHATYIDADFWIEGIEHRYRVGGVHETVFHLEEK